MVEESKVMDTVEEHELSDHDIEVVPPPIL